MHALVWRIDRQMIAEAAPQRGDQRVALAPVLVSHSADVGGKVSLFHEGGNHRLAERRWLAVQEISRGHEGAHLPSTELPALIERVTPGRFDEYVYVRAILAAHATQTGPALHDHFQAAQGTRKMMLESLMCYSAPKEFVATVQASLQNPDWRIRRTALGVLGYWFN